jgi:hypothetical protein
MMRRFCEGRRRNVLLDISPYMEGHAGERPRGFRVWQFQIVDPKTYEHRGWFDTERPRWWSDAWPMVRDWADRWYLHSQFQQIVVVVRR